ncbi:MAG TPA: hypothetical protein VJR29_00575 [bacterium]|nr:hypothetical protein [bacterium]
MKRRVKFFIIMMVSLLSVGILNQAAIAQDILPMLVYEPFDYVPQSELIPLGNPEDLGGTILEGDIELKGRIDFVKNGMVAGIFQATTRHGILPDFFTLSGSPRTPSN